MTDDDPESVRAEIFECNKEIEAEMAKPKTNYRHLIALERKLTRLTAKAERLG